MNQQFEMKRFWNTLLREYALNKMNLLIIFVSMVIVCLVITYVKGSVFTVPSSGQSIKIYLMWPFVIALYCTVITSFIFYDLNAADREVDYLMLPASQLEKYLSKFLITTVGFMVLGGIALLINKLQVDYLNQWADPTWLKQYTLISTKYFLNEYLVAHSIFFFGSIYFRKMQLAKTIIVLAALAFFVIMFSVMLVEVGLLDVVQIYDRLNDDYYLDLGTKTISTQSVTFVRSYLEIKESLAEFLIYYIVPPFFWLLGFLRLKETEVKNGV